MIVIRNPSSTDKDWNPESGIHGVESRIQDSWIPSPGVNYHYILYNIDFASE